LPSQALLAPSREPPYLHNFALVAMLAGGRPVLVDMPVNVRPATGGTEVCRTLNSALFAAVHFLEGAGLSDRFGPADLPGAVRVTAVAVRRALSARSVTLPV
jgi:hypothetical protein